MTKIMMILVMVMIMMKKKKKKMMMMILVMVMRMMMMMRVMMMMSGYDHDEDDGCCPGSLIAGVPKNNLRDGSMHVNSSCKHLDQRPMGAIPVRALALHYPNNGAMGDGREGVLPVEQ